MKAARSQGPSSLHKIRIISGGQTGIDRAALDVALARGIDCGGWCPAQRLDEYGRIPDRYPVKPLTAGGSAERTLRNVIESHGSLILCPGELRGGTQHTVQCCIDHQRPHLLIDATNTAADRAAELLSTFVRQHRITVLNVAGPRESEWPEGYSYASALLEKFVASREQL
ncbi:MAG: putative molybdenum carrier protein [Chthoniobacterales bacterium]